MSPRILIAAIAITAAMIAPWLPSSYVTMSNYVGIYAIVSLGLVLLTGICGLMSFGQAAFVGIGAYTTAILTTRTDFPVYLAALGANAWFSLICALIITGIVALVIGLITLRLSGHFLALSTLAWGVSIYYLFGTMDLFGRYAGIGGIPDISLFGFVLNTPLRMFYLISCAFLLAAIAISNLLDSRLGRAIRAIKDGEMMAEAMGIDAARLKTIVFLISALLAGMAGWLYAHNQHFVAPSPFSLHASINFLFMAVIGGLAHVWGALVGATVFTLLENWFQKDISHSLGLTGNFDAIIFGIVILLIVMKSPEGIWPLLCRIMPSSLTAKAKLQKSTRLPARTQPSKGISLLEVDSVTKRFGGLIANELISFTVGAGQIVALIGPNGAGKSTLFNAISGIDPPTKGHVRLCGMEIDALESREIAALGVSRTFQHVRLLAEMTVLENVAIGAHLRGKSGVLKSAIRLDRVEERQIMAEAAYQIRRVGLEESMMTPAGSLALGSQRIVEIARALCSDSILLLLDEPAAGLRYGEKETLATLLKSLREEGLSILLVEHDMDFLMKLADHVIVLDAGKKISEGPPKFVQNDPVVIEAYLGGVEE